MQLFSSSCGANMNGNDLFSRGTTRTYPTDADFLNTPNSLSHLDNSLSMNDDWYNIDNHAMATLCGPSNTNP